MTAPEMTDWEDKCSVLERIAGNYPADSAEYEAILIAAQALHFVNHLETQAKFRAWMDCLNKPLSALQILHAKLAGIDDLPHELVDDTLREVEQVLERLRHKRT